ncbi:MAG: hypothetical protein ACYTGB_19100 [Planctomycetota bacterium]|jgi:hypothetical protein
METAEKQPGTAPVKPRSRLTVKGLFTWPFTVARWARKVHLANRKIGLLWRPPFRPADSLEEAEDLTIIAGVFASAVLMLVALFNMRHPGAALLITLLAGGCATAVALALLLVPVGARAFFNEREAHTLEALILTPVHRENLLLHRLAPPLRLCALFCGLMLPGFVFPAAVVAVREGLPFALAVGLGAWAMTCGLAFSALVGGTEAALKSRHRVAAVVRGYLSLWPETVALILLVWLCTTRVLSARLAFSPSRVTASGRLLAGALGVAALLGVLRALSMLRRSAVHFDEWLLKDS